MELTITGSANQTISFTSTVGETTMVQFNFDATQVKPLGDYSPLPEGLYLVEITQSQEKRTKAGDGSYIELEYTVLDGEHKGSLHWDRLCKEHPSPKAVTRAKAALSAICYAIGIEGFRDTIELHHIPFQIQIRHRTDESGRVSAEVVGYATRPMVQSQFTAPQTGAMSQGPSPWGSRQPQ